MDSDDLLAEEDLIKPDPASLRSRCNFFFSAQSKTEKLGMDGYNDKTSFSVHTIIIARVTLPLYYILLIIVRE